MPKRMLGQVSEKERKKVIRPEAWIKEALHMVRGIGVGYCQKPCVRHAHAQFQHGPWWSSCTITPIFCQTWLVWLDRKRENVHWVHHDVAQCNFLLRGSACKCKLVLVRVMSSCWQPRHLVDCQLWQYHPAVCGKTVHCLGLVFFADTSLRPSTVWQAAKFFMKANVVGCSGPSVRELAPSALRYRARASAVRPRP